MEDTFGSHVLHLQHIFPEHKAFFARLRDEIEWKVVQWRVRPLPRLCCHSVQRYEVGQIVTMWLEEMFKTNFNCLVKVVDIFGNYYRDENDYLPQHSDNYSSSTQEIHVVSISFGASRRFTFQKHGKVALSMKLHGGDIVVFDAYMNRNYTHGIAKTKTKCESRINLTCFVKFDEVPYGRLPIGEITSPTEVAAKRLQEFEWM